MFREVASQDAEDEKESPMLFCSVLFAILAMTLGKMDRAELSEWRINAALKS
jgi:hypothetical protein